MSPLNVQIRPATLEDVEPIAELSEQLWYPVTCSVLAERLQRVTVQPEHVVYVAVVEELVVGWIHSCILTTLVMGQQAAIGGLIVRQGYRGQGIGRLLLQKAEQWTHQQGCNSMIIHSNALRQEAHQFYEKAGYQPFKTQLTFRKELNDDNQSFF